MDGMIFKGLNSSQFGVYIKSENRQMLPQVIRFIKQVPGFPGKIDFGNDTYDEKNIHVTLQFNYRGNLTTLRTKMEDLSGWLYNDGNYYDLTFEDEPNRKYKAKVTSQVDVTDNKAIATIAVTFTCNPPWPFLLDNTPISPADTQKRLLWDTATLNGIQYLQDFTANGTMRFTVSGTQPVKPIIKLIGYIKSGLTLTYGLYTWKYNADLLYDGIVIDCAAQTVTRMSDGVNLFSSVDPAHDDFFTLTIGQQSVIITGITGAWPLDLNIAVEFTPVGG